MLHLRAVVFFWLAVMTASFGWSLNALAAETQSGNDHWINTWTAGPMPPWAGGPLPVGFFNQTVRQVVRLWSSDMGLPSLAIGLSVRTNRVLKSSKWL